MNHQLPALLLATNNPGKVAELRALFQSCGWELVTPAELGIRLSDEETGTTYEENASQKALRGARAGGLLALADDSGLEIEALGGAPGVRSAEFMGRETAYPERFAEIRRRLAGVPRERRGARFVCVIAIADPSGVVRIARGEVSGVIVDEPRGERGFGYDPIFWAPEYSATMAELPERVKGIISHRARAAGRARQILEELLHEYRREGAEPG